MSDGEYEPEAILMIAEALRPCPRCGSPAEYVDYDDGPILKPFWYVACSNSTCDLKGELHETKVEAAADWNAIRRPPAEIAANDDD